MLEKTEGAIKIFFPKTIQRHWPHWAHKSQDEDKQCIQNPHTIQNTKKMSNTDPIKRCTSSWKPSSEHSREVSFVSE
jgi:hypothetical protein